MICHVTHGTDAWAFVKSYSRIQDGRGAFMALKAQYMGADFVNKVKLSADALHETLHWTGKAKHFTWENLHPDSLVPLPTWPTTMENPNRL